MIIKPILQFADYSKRRKFAGLVYKVGLKSAEFIRVYLLGIEFGSKNAFI
jgi:hypothetical protein